MHAAVIRLGMAGMLCAVWLCATDAALAEDCQPPADDTPVIARAVLTVPLLPDGRLPSLEQRMRPFPAHHGMPRQQKRKPAGAERRNDIGRCTDRDKKTGNCIALMSSAAVLRNG